VSRPRASGISSALWPSNTQRCIATSKIAQQRRFIIMKWPCMKRRTSRHMHLFYPTLAIMLLIGGMVLAIVVLQYWVILLTLAAAWSVMIICMIRLLFNGIYNTAVGRRGRDLTQRARRTPAVFRFPETPMPATPLIRVLETIDLSRADIENFMDDTGERQVSVSEQEQSKYSNQVDTNHL
jgi:hypothetical protein